MSLAESIRRRSCPSTFALHSQQQQHNLHSIDPLPASTIYLPIMQIKTIITLLVFGLARVDVAKSKWGGAMWLD